MSKGVSYFLGILTGIILTVAAVFVINKTNSSSDELTMFKERGKMMDWKSNLLKKSSSITLGHIAT